MSAVAEARRLQPLHPLRVGPRRAEAAEIEDRRPQRRRDRRVVELRVVGQRHHRRAGIEPELGERRVRPVVRQLGPREPRRAGEGLARVDDRDVVAGEPRHRHQRLRDVDGADHRHPERRVVHPEEPVAGESRAVGDQRRPRRLGQRIRGAGHQPPLPALRPHRIDDRLARRPRRHQPREQVRRRPVATADRLDHHPDPPAAGEPDREGLGVAHPVLEQPRAAVLQRLQRLRHHRALDAAAGDRARDLGLAADRELRAGRPRRRAPGLDHRRQRRPLGPSAPVERRLRNPVVFCRHVAPPRCSPGTPAVRANIAASSARTPPPSHRARAT